MKTYAGYVLMEKMFDSIATIGNSSLTSFSNTLFNPTVQVVEKKCSSMLGEVVTLDTSSIGLVELATNQPLTLDRINYLLSRGKYKIGIRTLRTCRSEGGVCAECYKAMFPDRDYPIIGSRVIIPPRYIVNEEVIEVSSTNPSVALNTAKIDYEYHFALLNSKDNLSFTIQNDIITTFGFTDNQPQLATIRFYRENALPYFQYLGRTFSADLLGFTSIDTAPLPLKTTLIESNIPGGSIDELMSQLENTPQANVDYLENIPGKLEKALTLIAMHCIYE